MAPGDFFVEETLLELLQIQRSSGLTAPIDGTVYSVAELDTTDGTTVTDIVTLSPDVSMSVTINVDESDILSLSVGQTAIVSVDALAGKHFPATVSQISNSGTNSGGSSKFTVELTLTKDGDMLPNMNASAAITLETIQDALCIPAAALMEADGKTVVYTALDEKTGSPCSPVEVIIGAADADLVQILSGLQEGDPVYYAYYEAAGQ